MQKIACESCEWDTYTDWLSDEVPLLHQIQVELHRAPAKDGAGGAIDFFDSMERAGYLRFHKEPNIQWAPDCVEYGFIKVEKTFMEGKKVQQRSNFQEVGSNESDRQPLWIDSFLRNLN